ncbi:exopolysaccharide biosynthesis polyprenyl glycosylphosphotransferase [Salinimicrobium sp. MT39]|uniref:Exopolysaccharide biosynthesis polyprenyl glycosylphosphotransferase n=1 Tax=Salinimicrobium profundisediminis TaxID=2994553 RepID=A0A9X3CVI8_9FLAO|nr:exopolysaccharide biosynthesis polyprenyl glycosylphosphotransferase [Salinimicrobium profundisediminis]MCX2837508.1 exopolysaccharide biosynthesis polyprenyl glycosylphosphotransferase [Salinimicrobium profundisediminis]
MPHKNKMHFEISERKIFLRIFDILWVLLALYVVGILFRVEYFNIEQSSWHWAIVLAIYLNLFCGIFELYDLQKASSYYRVLKNVVLATWAVVLFYLMTPVFTPVLPDNRLQILYFFLTICFTLLLWRFSYIALISTPRFYRRVLIIGEPLEVELVALHLQRSDPNYNIVGLVNPGGGDVINSEKLGLEDFSGTNLSEVVREQNIDEILISDVNSTAEGFYSQVLILLKNGFPVKDFNEVYEDKTHRIPVQHIERNFYQFFPLSRSNDNKFYLFFHRLFDILVSIIGIIIGALLLPFIYFGNMIANKGSLFYQQERIGRSGETFKILKFRTMRYNAEPDGAVWATKNDVRITRFGKFLRRSRLDEFPQFYNILKGEMSLIGPRPERPVFVKELSELIPFYDTRHFIKPGLTGWAQVMTDYADSHADSLEKLQYDLYYIKHRNIFLDITILTKTLSTVIFFRGQ